MATIEGTPNNDELFARNDGDELLGLEGDDVLEAVGFENTILRGGEGNDELFAGSNGSLFGEEGDDTLDATTGEGGNELDGGVGNDDLFAGGTDTLIGGEGNDRLFVVGATGDNTFTGGAGEDQFWIATAEIPQAPTVITDFTQDIDEIGIDLAGVVESFEQLAIAQNDAGDTTISIAASGEELAILQGFSGELEAVDFFFFGDPLAGSDTLTTTEDESVELNLLANDVDTSSTPDPLTVTEVNGEAANVGTEITLPSGAALTVNADGSTTYNPNGAFESLGSDESATDTFTYTIGDGTDRFDRTQATVNVTGVNDAPIADDITFSVDENAPEGTLVGTLTATDPENEALSFSIASGNVDVDGDGTAAFALDDEGRLTVADSGDLNFERRESFTLEAVVTDPDGASDQATVTVDINNIDEPEVLRPGTRNSLFLEGDNPANLLYSLTGNGTSAVNEIGFFLVDNAGEFAGALPGDEDFDLAGALEQRQVIFSTLAGQGPEVISDLLNGLERIIPNDPETGIAFYLVENSTTDTVLARQAGLDSVRLGAQFLEIDSPTSDEFALTWQLDEGAVTLSTALSDSEPQLGTASQAIVEVIDLRGENDVTATLGLNGVRSVAEFDNLFGLYVVDDLDGTVNGIAPGEDGYAAAALAQVVDDFILRGGSLENTSPEEVGSVPLTGGAIYAPFIIANGGNLSVEEFLEENPNNTAAEDPEDVVAYFPFLAANPDGADHLRLLADNTFGFEDLPGGGDQDFNDAIFQVQLA